MVSIIYVFFLSLCWGSFLNILAHRFINHISLLAPSACPRCHTRIAWYDNIPLISYVLLRGTCRTCAKPISWLYPFVEFLTAFSLTALYMAHDYFWGYFILFSALMVTIRSDLETMLISRFVTLALIPVGLIFSFFDLIPIVPINSIFGAALGYIFLWSIATVFTWITKKQGMGEGDFDLMALIGAFTGVLGAWASLLIGSLLGSACGILFLVHKGTFDRNTKIPFGPFLATGAILYVFFQEWICLALVGF